MPLTLSSRLLLETVDGVTVVTLNPPELVEEGVIHDLSRQLDEIAAASLARVVVNFREVRSMSSSVLAVLWKFARKVKAAGGQIKLCCVATDLLVAFRITRFDRLFEVHDEEWSALDSFSF